MFHRRVFEPKEKVWEVSQGVSGHFFSDVTLSWNGGRGGGRGIDVVSTYQLSHTPLAGTISTTI